MPSDSWSLQPLFSWGRTWPPPGSGNFPGLETAAAPRGPCAWPILNRRDPFPRVAPAGSFTPNPRGFFDLDGNVAEWALDVPTATEHPRPAHLVPGSSWMNADSAVNPLECSYDYLDTAVDARGFRVALQLAPPAGHLLHLTFHRVSDTAGTPHTDHPGTSRVKFTAGQTVRVTWRAENHGDQAVSFKVLHNASAGGPSWKTVYRSPNSPDRPALGGGVHLSASLAASQSAYFSFDMDTTSWPAGPIWISSVIHADTPAATCLETSSSGAGLPWIPPDWWLDAFTLEER